MHAEDSNPYDPYNFSYHGNNFGRIQTTPVMTSVKPNWNVVRKTKSVFNSEQAHGVFEQPCAKKYDKIYECQQI